MHRRSPLAFALPLVTACLVALSACGEQTPGGLPVDGQPGTGAEQSADNRNPGDRMAGESAVGGADAGESAARPAPDDPIVIQVGEDEYLTIMAIYRRYDDAKNTPLALLGPVAPAQELDGGKKQDFIDGTVYWSLQTGAQIVRGKILDTYLDTGGPTGRLGWPVGDETAEDAVIYSDFQHGQIRFEDQAIWVIEHSD